MKGRATQRGNGLLFALLGMLLTSMGAVAALQASRLKQLRDIGSGEAGVLQVLRNGANTAIFEQLTTLQAGQAFTKNSVTVTPATEGSDLVWRPTIAQLAAMAYLPSGWTVTTSTLNGAAYSISFKRVPTGCAAAACAIEGLVLIPAAINDTGVSGQMDGVTIGSILTQIGTDAGVSLPTGPATITGFDSTWSAANPVSGTPPGVVAVRVGTASNSMTQFVRLNDTRDPNLAGNLTIAGALSVGGTTTLRNANLNINNGSGTTCIQMTPVGTVTISCTGGLTATTVSTSSNISAGGNVSASGNVSATGTVTAGSTLSAAGGTFRVDSAGRIGTNGYAPTDLPGGWGGGLSTWDVYSHASIGAGTNGAIGSSMTSAGTLMAGNGQFNVTTNGVLNLGAQGSAGAACSIANGNSAITSDSAGVLLACQSGVWRPIGGRQQRHAFYSATDGTVIPGPGCPSSATAQIIVSPASIYINTTAALSYSASGSGPWTINIRDGSNAAVSGAAAQVETYCAYP